jgi:hypothetical protein
VSAIPSVDPPVSSHGFEAFLADVEQGITDAGQALLFSGDDLRLDITLLRHAKNPRVIWGLKAHEDWAFKATLLRFARGIHPVHFVLSTEKDGTHQLQGWVVRRTLDAFWASPLPAESVTDFWQRSQKLHAHEIPKRA